MGDASYMCENWTLSEKSIDKPNAFERKFYIEMMKIIWMEKRTNELVLRRVTETLDRTQ